MLEISAAGAAAAAAAASAAANMALINQLGVSSEPVSVMFVLAVLVVFGIIAVVIRRCL